MAMWIAVKNLSSWRSVLKSKSILELRCLKLLNGKGHFGPLPSFFTTMTTEDNMIIDLSESSPPPESNPNPELSLRQPEYWDIKIRAALAMLPPLEETRLRTKFMDGLALEYVSDSMGIDCQCIDVILSLMLHPLPAPRQFWGCRPPSRFWSKDAPRSSCSMITIRLKLWMN